MAKKKNFYYILVMSDNGPKFLTKVNYADRTAEWDELEKPLELGKERAEDLVMGLNLNYHLSYVVCSKWEIDSQPYRYSKWHIEWAENKEEEDEDETD